VALVGRRWHYCLGRLPTMIAMPVCGQLVRSAPGSSAAGPGGWRCRQLALLPGSDQIAENRCDMGLPLAYVVVGVLVFSVTATGWISLLLIRWVNYYPEGRAMRLMWASFGISSLWVCLVVALFCFVKDFLLIYW
jgi:hypothetical protein